MTAVGMVGVEGMFLNLRVETGRHLWGIGVKTSHHCNHPNQREGGFSLLPGTPGPHSYLANRRMARTSSAIAATTATIRNSPPPSLPIGGAYHRANLDGIRLPQPTLTNENVEETSIPSTQKRQAKRSSDVGSTIPRPCNGPVIVIDTREQLPWAFTLPTVVRGLPVGDYSIEGHETEVAIERKSLSDLVGSVTFGRARFWRELEKLAAYRLRAVVVEASVGDVLAGAYRSKAVPWAILTSALAITVDLDIPVIWGHTPACSARIAEWMLVRCMKRAAKGASDAA